MLNRCLCEPAERPGCAKSYSSRWHDGNLKSQSVLPRGSYDQQGQVIVPAGFPAELLQVGLNDPEQFNRFGTRMATDQVSESVVAVEFPMGVSRLHDAVGEKIECIAWLKNAADRREGAVGPHA